MIDLERVDETTEEEHRLAEMPRRSSFQVLGLAGLIVGLLGAFSACIGGPLLLLLTAAFSNGALDGATIQQSLALTVLGLCVGGILAWEGWRIWQGQPSRPFVPRRVGLLWLALALLLALGLLFSFFDAVSPYLLPPINTLTVILLPFLLLIVVGQVMQGRGGSWRDVAGGLVSGAALGTGLALLLEIALAGAFLALALILGLIPGGVEGLEALSEQLQDPAFLNDPQNLLQFFSPLTVLVLFLFAAVLAPLIEELTKTAGLAVAGPWLRPTPARAFVLGVASGAGFAIAENLFNGALIGAFWAPGVVLRLGATLMHCATSGLMGWGWGQLWAARRPLRAASAFLGAMGLHSIWNALAVAIAVSSLLALQQADNPTVLALLGLAALSFIAVLALLALSALAGLIWAGRALGRQAEGE